MEYSQYQYLWPPRPEKAIPRNLLSFYEKRGFWAQAKLNGTCSVIFVSPKREVTFMTRHNEPHKLWRATDASKTIFQTIPGNGWHVFVAELLHSKVTGGPKDTHYLHDCIVANNKQLVGETFASRQDRLSNLFLKGGEEEEDRFFSLDDRTWLAKNHKKDFAALFETLVSPFDEGLVLKKADAPLAACFRATSNAAWQVKARRPHANYAF